VKKVRSDNLDKYVYGKQNLNWALLHSNKCSITLDLKSEDGKRLLTELIKISDVMIENFSPGTIERLGFSYEKIKQINPRCIFCQIKGYLPANPFYKYGAMDATVQATSGLASQTGLEGSPPVISNVALADVPSGDYAMTGIITALFQRERTGRGQHVEIYRQEVALSYSRLSFANTTYKRGVPMQFKGANGPKNLFRCKPRYEGDKNNYVFIAVRDTPGQRMWRDFYDIMGRMDLFDDPRYATGPTRSRNKELEEEITKRTIQHDKLDIMKWLSERGVTAGAVLSMENIANLSDMFDSGFLRKYNHPRLGEIVLPTMAIRLSDSPVDIEHSPDLGEHNEEVYKGLLGLADEELEDLRARKVI